MVDWWLKCNNTIDSQSMWIFMYLHFYILRLNWTLNIIINEILQSNVIILHLSFFVCNSTKRNPSMRYVMVYAICASHSLNGMNWVHRVLYTMLYTVHCTHSYTLLKWKKSREKKNTFSSVLVIMHWKETKPYIQIERVNCF